MRLRMSVLSMTTIRRLWKIAPPHGQVMMMKDLPQVSSLDMVDDDATPCTHVDDGSCSGYESEASTSSPSPHCFMSQGDTKVQNANVVDHIDSYDELVSRLASMTMILENEKAKTLKLE